MLPDMTKRLLKFIQDSHAQLGSSTAMGVLQDPLGGVVGLIQANPGSTRAKILRELAQGIFNAPGELDIRAAFGLERTALLVACRLAEEHLACRYSGEEWGDAFKAMDEAIRQDA
jgi:hypothetical protein